MGGSTSRARRTTSTSSTLRDRILAAEDIPSEDVEVPEWDLTVQVRGLSGVDRDAYEANMRGVKQAGAGAEADVRLANFRAKLLVKTLFDPATGERIFDGARDAQALGGKSAKALERLFDITLRLSGMDAKAKESAEGNSETAPSGGSTTG